MFHLGYYFAEFFILWFFQFKPFWPVRIGAGGNFITYGHRPGSIADTVCKDAEGQRLASLFYQATS